MPPPSPSPRRRPSSGWLVCVGATLLAGCGGPFSTLEPAGREAESIAALWWWMAIGALVIWAAMLALLVYAGREREDVGRFGNAGTGLIVGGGVVLPIVVLTALLIRGLGLLSEQRAPADPDGVHIAVVGEEWWWRVRYHLPNGEVVETANEVRLPAGQRTAFSLTSADVIHSFWIPSLGGKMDMIPGRETGLALEPTRTGRFGGWCAEYCGEAHTYMRLEVEVMEPAAFEIWLDSLRAPAPEPTDARARRGGELFLHHGCGACHTIRGTGADGLVGPDLTHLGRRAYLGAGVVTNDVEGLVQWITWPEQVKPGTHMPGFAMLEPDDLLALATYLEGLR